MMKNLLSALLILLFPLAKSYGQSKSNPKNLTQAVQYLDADFPDYLKAELKKTDDKNLEKLTISSGTYYKTINNWLDDEHSKLYKYLASKGVIKLRKEAVLLTYKRHLLNEPFNEDTILKPYIALENRWKLENENKYAADTIRGVYIPKDLEDCFVQLDKVWSDSTKAKARKQSENEFSAFGHLTTGMWMRNNWQLTNGSRLSKFFNSKGIKNPNEMSGLILMFYHRHLTGKPIAFEEHLKMRTELLKATEEKAIKQMKEEFSRYHIGDTLVFRYYYAHVTEEQEKKFNRGIELAKGILLEKNESNFQVRIKIIETSDDENGIIYYDNKGASVLNPKTKKWEQAKRVIKKMKSKQTLWFYYEDWKPLKKLD